LVISQGVAQWLADANLCRNPDQKGPDAIEEILIGGSEALLLKFTHPSTPSNLGWGNSPNDKYLLDIVKPTVEEAMRRLLPGSWQSPQELPG